MNKLLQWSLGNDIGVSSKQIMLRYSGLPLTDPSWGYPHDNDDFGRCYRLLKQCPEINIECMRGFNRVWDNLVDKWPELTELHEAENGQRVYSLIKECERPFRDGCSMHSKDLLYSEQGTSNSTKIDMGGVSIATPPN
jgi:hypothetical protein